MTSTFSSSSFPIASHISPAMERTNQWVFSQDIPSDITIVVGESSFSLHKFMLVPKSGYIRRKIMESERVALDRVDLSELPGGAAAFERAAKFCYGVNFEISVQNVAALRCAAEFLEMTEEHCRGNLAERAEDFIGQAALKTLPGAVAVLRSCEGEILGFAEELGIVQRCVDAIALKVCNEANFPTRSPAEWWAAELSTLGTSSFQKVLTAMRCLGAGPRILAVAITIYAQKAFPNLLPLSGSAVIDVPAAHLGGSDTHSRQRGLIESLVSALPSDRDAPLPVGFLCCLLRAAIFLEASPVCRRELERRIAASLDQAAVADLLAITLDYSGERIADLDSARRIVAGFAERESGPGGVYGGGGACCSAAAQKVARTVDAFVCEIATDEDMPVSKFAGIAGALPKSARRFDDDLYRAVDIYLKAHPGLDEIEREKVCSVMDPLRLSYEARLHASQNKRLPLQILLHALYYDQLKLRSSGGGAGDEPASAAAPVARVQAKADASLLRENEALRSELAQIKMYVSELQRGQGSGSARTVTPAKKTAATFFSSVSRKLGKLNPFKHESKDTLAIVDGEKVDVTKPPRRRRFSIS